MKVRMSVCLLALFSLTGSLYADGSGRLFFRNISRATSNTGRLDSSPGDTIALHWSYQTSGAPSDRWGVFQVTFDLTGNSILSTVEANTWNAQLGAFTTPDGDFPLKVFWQPSQGNLYDYCLNPADSTKGLVTTKGLFAMIGVVGTSPLSTNVDVDLFQFHVAAGSEGQDLKFLFENRVTGTGLATRVIDGDNKAWKVSDNYLHVVPEPTLLLLVGGIGLLLRKRR